jgi:hypothetical protein
MGSTSATMRTSGQAVLFKLPETYESSIRMVSDGLLAVLVG